MVSRHIRVGQIARTPIDRLLFATINNRYEAAEAAEGTGPVISPVVLPTPHLCAGGSQPLMSIKLEPPSGRMSPVANLVPNKV